MKMTTRITATKHHGAAAIAAVAALREGEQITLRREPGNKVDPKAVSCWRDEQFLGYVPKRDNADLARLMDHGGNATTVVKDRAIMLSGSIREEPRIAITVEEAQPMATGAPPRYEGKLLSEPNPKKLYALWDRFIQGVIGIPYRADEIDAVVARHNSAFERSLQD